jgi:hypothetical protein
MIETLLAEYGEVQVHEVELDNELKGFCFKNHIFIHRNLTEAEKLSVLSEELGHFKTTVGDILDQTDVRNVKQEKRARNWGYELVVPLTKIIEAYKKGCKDRFEIAEFIGITELFLMDAIKHYNEKYGIFARVDTYYIYFEPLGILERMCD